MSGGFIHSFLDLIYPRKCPGCKLPRSGGFVQETVCADCWQAIEKNTPPFCSSCGRHLSADRITENTCADCRARRPHFDRAFAPCVYTGVIQELIQEFKYRGKDYLEKPLSALMIGFIEDYGIPVDSFGGIVPIPLHPARLREREFNQAELLSRSISRRFNLSVLGKTLVRTRHTAMQAQLPDSRRRANIAGSFTVTDPAPLSGRNILLIDDVLTTGATASEAASTLKQAGASSVTVMTLAS